MSSPECLFSVCPKVSLHSLPKIVPSLSAPSGLVITQAEPLLYPRAPSELPIVHEVPSSPIYTLWPIIGTTKGQLHRRTHNSLCIRTNANERLCFLYGSPYYGLDGAHFFRIIKSLYFLDAVGSGRVLSVYRMFSTSGTS